MKMTVAKISIILASMLAFAQAEGMKTFNKEGIDAQKASAIFNCIATIVCDIMKGYEMKRIYDKAGEESQGKGVQWLGEAYGFTPDMWEDHEIFWKDYSKNVCKFNEDQRRDCFKQFMMKFGEHFEQICQRPDPTECKKANEALVEGEEIVREYTENGTCNNPEEAGKELAGKGQEKMGGFSG